MALLLIFLMMIISALFNAEQATMAQKMLKYLSNFWRTLKMTLINCEINLILTWSVTCSMKDDPVNNQVPKFELTDTKIFVLVVTLLTQDNTKLLQQLKLGFKITISWKKISIKNTNTGTKPIFRLLNRSKFSKNKQTFVLSFENTTGGKVEIKER